MIQNFVKQTTANPVVTVIWFPTDSNQVFIPKTLTHLIQIYDNEVYKNEKPQSRYGKRKWQGSNNFKKHL